MSNIPIGQSGWRKGNDVTATQCSVRSSLWCNVSDPHRLDLLWPNTNSIKTDRHQAPTISSFWGVVVSFLKSAQVSRQQTIHLLMKTARCDWKHPKSQGADAECRLFCYCCAVPEVQTFLLKFLTWLQRCWLKIYIALFLNDKITKFTGNKITQSQF